MAANQQVLQYAGVLEQLDVLERTGYAKLGNLFGLHRSDVVPVKVQRATSGLVESADQIKDRRLAGAVWANNGKYLSGLN